ncbi:hypothetical protein DVW87_02115 [Sphingomonas aracearum]|uniref:Uncharacterized protein n=1 Tax=Sphingomonas aracearum TaxID=2283317 RepID=A0A369VY30_9SPHN|nr:hypothetical protein DVW87_02115 [Sphingomonas aracearum]
MVPSPVDTSAIQSQIAAAVIKAEQAAAAAAQVQAAVPQPATTVGSAEMVGGQVGTATTYKRGDWVPARISRTGSCVLAASNACMAAWTSAFAVGTAPVMLGDPVAINTAALQPIDCDITGAPTATGVPVKCWIAQSSALTLTALTAGKIDVLPFGAASLAGTTVTVSAIPPSQ